MSTPSCRRWLGVEGLALPQVARRRTTSRVRPRTEVGQQVLLAEQSRPPRRGSSTRPSSRATNARVTSSATRPAGRAPCRPTPRRLVRPSISSSMFREIVRMPARKSKHHVVGQVGDAVADDRRPRAPGPRRCSSRCLARLEPPTAAFVAAGSPSIRFSASSPDADHRRDDAAHVARRALRGRPPSRARRRLSPSSFTSSGNWLRSLSSGPCAASASARSVARDGDRRDATPWRSRWPRLRSAMRCHCGYRSIFVWANSTVGHSSVARRRNSTSGALSSADASRHEDQAVGEGQERQRRRGVAGAQTAHAGRVDHDQPLLQQRARHRDLDPLDLLLVAAGCPTRDTQSDEAPRSARHRSTPAGRPRRGGATDGARLLAVAHERDRRGRQVVVDRADSCARATR